jgi:uncharacterized membrane protein YGL010W
MVFNAIFNYITVISWLSCFIGGVYLQLYPSVEKLGLISNSILCGLLGGCVLQIYIHSCMYVNYITVISWLSCFIGGVYWENHRPAASLTNFIYNVSSNKGVLIAGIYIHTTVYINLKNTFLDHWCIF